jgi:hypothetical protein
MPDKSRWRVGGPHSFGVDTYGVYRDGEWMFECKNSTAATEVVELLNRGQTERERCAQIAETYEGHDCIAGHKIAARIRSEE